MALMLLVALPEEEAQGGGEVVRHSWRALFDALVDARRATRLKHGARHFWVAAEQLPLVMRPNPDAGIEPRIEAPASYAKVVHERSDAIPRTAARSAAGDRSDHGHCAR